VNLVVHLLVDSLEASLSSNWSCEFRDWRLDVDNMSYEVSYFSSI